MDTLFGTEVLASRFIPMNGRKYLTKVERTLDKETTPSHFENIDKEGAIVVGPRLPKSTDQPEELSEFGKGYQGIGTLGNLKELTQLEH